MNKLKILPIITILCICCENKSSKEENVKQDSEVELQTPDAYSAFLNMTDEPQSNVYEKLFDLVGEKTFANICSEHQNVLWDLGFTVTNDSLVNFEISTFIFDDNNSLIQNSMDINGFNAKTIFLKKSDFQSLENVSNGDYSFMIKSQYFCDKIKK